MLVWNASLSLLMLVIFKGLLIAACVFVLKARGSDSLYKFTDLEGQTDWPGPRNKQDAWDVVV